LKIIDRYKCRKIVFSNSSIIYGLSDNYRIYENREINHLNPYGKTKTAIVQLLNKLYLSNPQEWNIANLLYLYFNQVGAYTSGMIGESQDR